MQWLPRLKDNLALGMMYGFLRQNYEIGSGEKVKLYQPFYRILKLVSVAYPGVDGSVRDSLTLDQFILALNNQEMQWSVIDSDTKTAEEAVKNMKLSIISLLGVRAI